MATDRRSVISRYALLWLGLPFIGILNGTIRELFYTNALGELFAHQLSSFIAVLLISVNVWILEGRWKLSSLYEALAVGLIWLVQTIMPQLPLVSTCARTRSPMGLGGFPRPSWRIFVKLLKTAREICSYTYRTGNYSSSRAMLLIR